LLSDRVEQAQCDSSSLVSCNSDSLNKSADMDSGRPLGKPRDAGENLVGGLGPHEGSALFVASLDKLPDRALQFADTAMRPASQLFRGQLGEPPFDQVEPRPVG